MLEMEERERKEERRKNISGRTRTTQIFFLLSAPDPFSFLLLSVCLSLSLSRTSC